MTSLRAASRDGAGVAPASTVPELARETGPRRSLWRAATWAMFFQITQSPVRAGLRQARDFLLGNKGIGRGGRGNRVSLRAEDGHRAQVWKTRSGWSPSTVTLLACPLTLGRREAEIVETSISW